MDTNRKLLLLFIYYLIFMFSILGILRVRGMLKETINPNNLINLKILFVIFCILLLLTSIFMVYMVISYNFDVIKPEEGPMQAAVREIKEENENAVKEKK